MNNAINKVKSVFVNSDGNLRKVFYILISLIVFGLVYKICNYMEFGVGALWGFECTVIVISGGLYLAKYKPTKNEEGSIGTLTVVAGVFALLSLLLSSVGVSRSKTEYHVPQFVAHTDCLTIVQDGTQVLTSDKISIYKKKNPMVCKTLKWNHYNIRLNDVYSICD